MQNLKTLAKENFAYQNSIFEPHNLFMNIEEMPKITSKDQISSSDVISEGSSPSIYESKSTFFHWRDGGVEFIII